jgi:DNA-binding NtrC family response regulator
VTSTGVLDRKAGETLTLPGARLVVLRGPDRPRALRLEKEEVVVGSSESADLRLTDGTISRSHFSLRIGPHGYLVTDLESTNGTFVDGRRVSAMWLKLGDKIDLGRTRLRLEKARESIELSLSTAESFGALVGRSVGMRRLFATLTQIAPTDATILIQGESGTGKDAVAEAIHAASPRAEGPFVVVDCGAIAPALIESELFGHEKGAFTGAVAARAGAFREAHRGTLFLDEIGELPRELQPRLLRGLEGREVRPLGGSAHVPVDVRVIAATNRDLKLAVNTGQFREDLFYRLNVIALRVPPLRERLDDLPLLAARFWRDLTGEPEAALPADFLPPLATHDWPGNVRELRNRVERAVSLGRPIEISKSHQPEHEQPYRVAKQAVLDEFERRYLGALMARAKGNQSEAARLAELDRPHLIKLLKKHGLGRKS